LSLQPITLQPIGLIRSPFAEVAGMPIQAVGATGIAGAVELDPAYAAGLQDLDGFSHLILIYHLHRVASGPLTVVPFLDDQPRGVFATRSPRRPNCLGLSIVRLVAVNGARLEIEDVDVVDGTPLLDIKPYVPAFDVREADRIGWFEGKVGRARHARADDRFAHPE
jgi:tRNA-Thr(GGU) m(6)t(6)A37 methyltransferase TsaA